MEPLGLRRGVEGSTAEHERVKRHYGQIAAPVTELKIERPPRLIIDPEGWATEQAASVAQQAAPALARAQTAESDRTARKSAVAQATKERGRRERAEASLERQKAVTDRMRALPLPDVLTHWAFSRTRRSLIAGGLKASMSPSAPDRRQESGGTTQHRPGEAEPST